MAFKNLLDENKVSKYELSKKTNIPYSTISDIINDKVVISKCSYDVLHKIASFFEIPKHPSPQWLEIVQPARVT